MHSAIFSKKEPLVTKEAIAAALGVSPLTLNRWVRDYPDFPAVKLPGSNLFRKSEVQVWVASLPKRPKRGRPKTVPALVTTQGEETLH